MRTARQSPDLEVGGPVKARPPARLLRLSLAVLIPLAAFALQSMFWAAIRPFAWFLFFPAVFLSSWVGGLPGGVIATAISTALAWWFFIPPEGSLALEDPFTLGSIGLFVGMGALFGYSQERIKQANGAAAEALAATRSANEQLQVANAKITQLYERTRELDQLKTQLFANVSHELRTPLTLILGPVAKRLAAGDLGDEARRDLELVDRNARLLYRHVSDLLDVARLEAGRMHMRYAPVDLARLARFVASHFEVLAGEKRIRYAVDTPETLPAQVDAEKCQRILLNLLSNAFKFTPDGGAVGLSVREEGGRAVMQVQDNGPGVPAALREAIFERFRQVEGGAERRFGGTGLGLAIVKEFIGLHAGVVESAEAPGGGALFTVTLPLAAPEGAEIQPTPSTLDEEIHRQALDELRTPPPVVVEADAPLVLVVEDNSEMNAFVAEALGRHYRVATAFDGREGLRQAIETHPDLIVSDVMMPGLSGEQLVEALRRRRELDGIPIVMLTAKADDELRVKLLREGVQDYVQKPYSAEELLARVGRLLSERRQADQALRDSEARYRRTLDNMLEGCQIIGFDWRYLYLNDAAARYGRRAREALLGRTVMECYPGIEATEMYAVLRRCMEERTARVADFEFAYPDGTRGWFEFSIQPVPEGIFILSLDVTERKRAEAALRESEERFSLIFEKAAFAAALSRLPEGILVDVNEAWVRAFGYTKQEAVGKTTLDLNINPDPGGRARIVAALQERGTVRDQELTLRTKAGEWRTLAVNIDRVDLGGQPYVLNTAQDITARKRAEEELRQLNAELEQRVAERTAQLEAKHRELETFTYSVSHDLKAPLRGVDGYSRLLLEDHAGQLDDEGRAFLHTIRRATQQMSQLIDDLLAYSRLERRLVQTGCVDPRALVAALLAERDDELRARRVAVTVDLPCESVTADPEGLALAVRNLLDNALKFTRDVPDPVIGIGGRETEAGCCLWVRDNGVGFDMRFHDRIFEIFQRLHRAEDYPGTGVGLAMVRRAMERSGGRAWAESAPGKGATFFLEVPR